MARTLDAALSGLSRLSIVASGELKSPKAGLVPWH
jgi:hypothetical protein